MLIGIDFDNTIVSYDTVFPRAALEKGLVPSEQARTKRSVRDYLRAQNREDDWTRLQGEVYGVTIAEAPAHEGVIDFLLRCRAAGVAVRIVSHKTQYPALGPKHDCRAAARRWLQSQGFFARLGFEEQDVFFENTRGEKAARVGTLGCTHFIDDLEETFAEPEFPAHVKKFLYSPAEDAVPAAGVQLVKSWWELADALFAAAQ